MPFPPNKTIKELGIDVSRRFVVVVPCSFKKGDILELAYDDDSICPKFRGVGDRVTHFVELSNLDYAPEQDEVKTGQVWESKANSSAYCKVFFVEDDVVFVGETMSTYKKALTQYSSPTIMITKDKFVSLFSLVQPELEMRKVIVCRDGNGKVIWFEKEDESAKFNLFHLAKNESVTCEHLTENEIKGLTNRV